VKVVVTAGLVAGCALTQVSTRRFIESREHLGAVEPTATPANESGVARHP
jgi:hypothetical protein